MPVFTQRINKKLTKVMNSKTVDRAVLRKANSEVRRAKVMLDSDIDADPVSRAIDSDPQTIGYFGFEEGDLPVEALKISLDEKISVDQRVGRIGSNQFQAKRKVKVKFPSSREIYSDPVLKLPWISKSWVEGVEKGLSGVERFAFKPGKGRSEFGIQLKGKVKDPISPLQDSDYIARIRKYFRENIRKARP